MSNMFHLKPHIIFLTVSFFSKAIFAGSPPVITEHPQGLSVARGAPASLMCSAVGNPTPTISWFRNGERVLTGAGDHTVLLPGGSLFFLRTVENHRSQDSGEYTCRAENMHGVVYSNSAQLTVKYLKHEFGHVPKLMTADQGETLALACFPPEGNPKPTITWLKGGTLINLNSGKYSLDPSGILMVNKLESRDSGRYSCRVSNDAGIRQDSPITLNIKDTPAVVKPSSNDHEYNYDTSDDDTMVIIEDILYLPSPVITDSLLLDSTTGLVHWLPVPECSSYTVRVSVGAQEITNISVQADVNQIKLHSLDPDLVYSVRIAAVIEDGTTSEFSPPSALTDLDIKEITIHMTESEQVPANIWIIGMIIVIIFTLAVLISAVLIFHKLNLVAAKNKEVNIEESMEGADYQDKMKRYSWIDKRWTPNQISSFKSEGLLLDESHYDYVVHSQHNGSIYRPLTSSPDSMGRRPIEVLVPCSGQFKDQEVYHYASTPLTKQYLDSIQKV